MDGPYQEEELSQLLTQIPATDGLKERNDLKQTVQKPPSSKKGQLPCWEANRPDGGGEDDGLNERKPGGAWVSKKEIQK